MATLNQQVAEEVRVALARRGWTVSKLADEMGLDRGTLRGRLNGRTKGGLTVGDVEQIARLLELQPRDLLQHGIVGRGMTTELLGQTTDVAGQTR